MLHMPHSAPLFVTVPLTQQRRIAPNHIKINARERERERERDKEKLEAVSKYQPRQTNNLKYRNKTNTDVQEGGGTNLPSQQQM